MKFVRGMRAELKVDCYGGESCEEHVPYWWMYADGDMDSDTSRGPIALDPKAFPPGTKVTVEIPVCPECDCHPENCQCGFDWKQWAEEQYA